MKVIDKQYNNNQFWSRLLLPDNITGPMMLVVFHPGMGEDKPITNPDGTVNLSQTLDQLYLNGSPLQQFKNGFQSITDPFTGKVYQLAVLGMNAGYAWHVGADACNAIVKETLAAYPQMDKSLTVITGLSAGGAGTMAATGADKDGLYAAAYPLSAAGAEGVWAGKKTLYWFIHGLADGVVNKATTDNYLWQLPAGKYRATYPEGWGHYGWDKYYDPNYRESFAGGSYNYLHLPFILKANPAFTFADKSIPVSTPPVTTSPSKPTTMPKAVLDIKQPGVIPNSVLFIPGNSTGAKSYSIDISPAGGSWYEGTNSGGAELANRNLVGLKDGTYTATLNMIGTDGIKYTDTKTFTVGTPSAKTIKKVTIEYSDGSTEVKP